MHYIRPPLACPATYSLVIRHEHCQGTSQPSPAALKRVRSVSARTIWRRAENELTTKTLCRAFRDAPARISCVWPRAESGLIW